MQYSPNSIFIAVKQIRALIFVTLLKHSKIVKRTNRQGTVLQNFFNIEWARIIPSKEAMTT